MTTTELDLLREVEAGLPDRVRARALLDDARQLGLKLDLDRLASSIGRALNSRAKALLATPDDAGIMDDLSLLRDISDVVTIPVNAWKAQNAFYAVARQRYEAARKQAGEGDDAARRWVESARRLGEKLRIRLE